MNISKKQKGSVKLPVFKFEGDDIEITVRKAALTLSFLQSAQDLQAKGESYPLAEQLAKSVVDWNLVYDVTDASGEIVEEDAKFPITTQNFFEVCSVEFVAALLETMVGVLSGNPQKPKK